MRKIGNLFVLAEKQLIKDKRAGIIPCYTIEDIIEYAILIRKWLDENENKLKKVINLTKEELKINHRKAQKRYYLKRKRE